MNDDMLREWYEEHGGEIRRFLTKLCGDPHRAEDLLQETFVRAALKFSLFDPDRGSARAWLYRMAIHLARDAERFRCREARLQADFGASLRHRADERPGEKPGLTETKQALARLDVEKRSLILLALFNPLAELARLLSVPEGTVKSRLFHARRELSRLLSTQESEDERWKNNN